jgi:DNA-binding YbaB/EbfC family protein
MSFDMNKMLKEAQRMQEELAKAQEHAVSEIVEASAGGVVTVKANGADEVVSITIDPKAIDPDDPELLADLVLAAVNAARALMESNHGGRDPQRPGDLGGLFPAPDFVVLSAEVSRGARGDERKICLSLLRQANGVAGRRWLACRRPAWVEERRSASLERDHGGFR